MTGGIENAAWQTAVEYYVAEYWDRQVSGLDSMHFVTSIDGAPCFRRNDRRAYRSDAYRPREGLDHLSVEGFANSIREFQGDETEDQDGEPYSLDRLAAGLAIGDNNGDVVFLDPEDAYSVWIWHHDGSDVERLADSFDKCLETATLDESARESDASGE
jgi:hypothetical protein